VRHPELVSRLILFGGFARGFRRRGDSELVARAEALITLMRPGWGADNPAFRQIFTSLFVPGASSEQMDWFNELQRRTTSPENAARLLSAVGDFDVSHCLSLVTQPTLVMHPRGDALTLVDFGRALEDEPAWPQFVREVAAFLHES
jgi:pimeloyl-ACP methyl ester carboxylesterase